MHHIKKKRCFVKASVVWQAFLAYIRIDTFLGKTVSRGVAIGSVKTPAKLSSQQNVSMHMQARKA
jgi:hypothetical protein